MTLALTSLISAQLRVRASGVRSSWLRSISRRRTLLIFFFFGGGGGGGEGRGDP